MREIGRAGSPAPTHFAPIGQTGSPGHGPPSDGTSGYHAHWVGRVVGPTVRRYARVSCPSGGQGRPPLQIPRGSLRRGRRRAQWSEAEQVPLGYRPARRAQKKLPRRGAFYLVASAAEKAAQQLQQGSAVKVAEHFCDLLGWDSLLQEHRHYTAPEDVLQMQCLPELASLTAYGAYGTLVCARVSYIAGRFRLYHLPEGGDSMRITFHIGN